MRPQLVLPSVPVHPYHQRESAGATRLDACQRVFEDNRLGRLDA